MADTPDVKICVIDRPDGIPASPIDELEERWNVQRLLPDSLAEIDPDTTAVYIRAGYWNEIDELLRLAPAVRWIHVAMAGVEHLVTERLSTSDVVLTNSQGVLDAGIAEFTLGAALLWSKGLLRSVADTRLRQANYRNPLSNRELSAVIIGAGGIGTACAAALRANGVGSVIGVRRNPEAVGDDFHGAMTFSEAAGRMDDFTVVIAALPATTHTAGMLDADFLSGLGAQCVFINVGRGVTVDNVALAEEMQRRPDSAAVLDVTDPEPLPQDHPLWECDNVVISPHMSGETNDRHENFARLFVENLCRFVNGSTLRNVVDTSVYRR